MIESALPLLLKAALITIEASALGAVFGSVFGVLMGLASCNRLKVPGISQLIAAYVTIIRGTPMFIQLLFVYFALPEIIGVDIAPLPAGVIALSINSAAYLSEIVRGGLNSIPSGQWEACETLGYSTSQALIYMLCAAGVWA